MERQFVPQDRTDSDVLFRHLMTCHADGVVVVSRYGIVRFVNPTAEELLQCSADGLIGTVFGYPVMTGETTELNIVTRSGDLTIAEMRVVDFEWAGDSALLAFLRDITANKRTESALRQREEQLHQTQNMEAVGRLAGKVAHEFNNLLTAIMGYNERLQRHQDDGAMVSQCAERMSSLAERAAWMARQILTFSRHQHLQPQVLDWNAVIEETETLLQPLIGASITFTRRLSPDLWPVRANLLQLQQLLMNLVLNASEAMVEGGELTLTTANVTLEAGPQERYFETPPGPYVRLEVRDTGIGLDTELFPRLFDPFFPPQNAGHGTGLRLAVVYEIVQQTHGDITVHRAPASGTIFRVYLPALNTVSATGGHLE